MFCEKYESDADCAAAEIIGGAFPVEFSDGLRERIDLPEGGEIIDCWTEPVPNPKLSDVLQSHPEKRNFHGKSYLKFHEVYVLFKPFFRLFK